LGISPNITNWSPDSKEFSLIFDDNPLADFVELPEEAGDLYYSNILCGVLRGALEMVIFFFFSFIEVLFENCFSFCFPLDLTKKWILEPNVVC